MTHYHVAFGDEQQNYIAQAFYDNYEESILDFSNFATLLFANHTPLERLSFEYALEATCFGDGFGAMAGEVGLCVYWFRCERCRPFTLN